MGHREGIRSYLKDVQVHGLVIDWGCGSKPIKNYLKNIEGVRFIGVDKADHVGADVVADMEQPLVLEEADFAFCLEVLEHIWHSKALIDNVFKNLKKGGVFYLTQPFFFEVHKEDDRIRYTHHGLRQLLQESGFTVADIQSTLDDINHAVGYVVKAIK